MSKECLNHYIVTFEISSELAFEELQEKLSRNPKDVNFEMLVLLTEEDWHGEPEYVPPYQPTLTKHAEKILKGDEPGGTKRIIISN